MPRSIQLRVRSAGPSPTRPAERAALRVGRSSTLLSRCRRGAAAGSASGIITVVDAHQATLSWLGAVKGHRVIPLCVDRFGESGDIPDLFHAYGIDADAIVGAAARLVLP